MNCGQNAVAQRPLLWPSAFLLTLMVPAVVYPVAFLAVMMLTALVWFGFRYPVATAAAVLVLIPVIDQAIADREFANLFGAFRITPAVVLKAMMSLVIGSYLVRTRINPWRFAVIRPMLLWLGYTFLTCLTFHDRGLAVSMWLRLAYWVCYFVFFYVVAATTGQHSRELQWLWKAGVFSVVIFAGSVHAAKVMGIGGGYYKVGESYGFYADPWNMSMTLPGGLVLALLYPWIAKRIGRPGRVACFVLVFATILAAFFTMTRTSLIACLFALVLFGVTLHRISGSRRSRLIFVTAAVFVMIAVLFVYRNMTSSRQGNEVSARWSEVDKGDIASGRLEVFYAAWTKFVTASRLRQVIGHGIGAGPEAAEEFMGVYVYLHDDFLENLVCAGLIGVFLYVLMFSRFYLEVLRGFRMKSIWAVAALTALAVYNLTSISYMRIYAVTPNTYFALAAGTSLGVLHRIIGGADVTARGITRG